MIKNKELKVKIKILIVKKIVIKSLNLNAKNILIKIKLFTKKIITQYIKFEKNKKYFDVSFFYNNKDK